MKNIYIGDIHGRDIWKQIVKEHEDANNIVFIGDYFDSFDINPTIQLRNAEDIVDFKKMQELDPSKKVHLLIGNHDIHYWPGILHRGSTSGFQTTMLPTFEFFFRENEHMFQMCSLIDDRLCTHAGVSDKFLKYEGYYKYDNIEIDKFLNDLFKYKPNQFEFSSVYDKIEGFFINDYGDNEEQSPIWIRPKSLQRANKNTDLKKKYIQIIGHTTQNCIDIKGKTTGGRYFYIDTLGVGEYLIDIDGEFSIGYIKE